MKWKPGSSPDVIDARGGGSRRGGMGLPMGRGGRVGGGLGLTGVCSCSWPSSSSRAEARGSPWTPAVGGGSPAFDPQPGGIPADQGPDRDLKELQLVRVHPVPGHLGADL